MPLIDLCYPAGTFTAEARTAQLLEYAAKEREQPGTAVVASA